MDKLTGCLLQEIALFVATGIVLPALYLSNRTFSFSPCCPVPPGAARRGERHDADSQRGDRHGDSRPFLPLFFDSFLSHYFWGGNGVGCKEAAIMAIIIRNYLLVANRVVPFFPAGEACLKNPFA